MKVRLIVLFASCIALAVSLTACSRTEREWRSSQPFSMNGEFLPSAPVQIERSAQILPEAGEPDNRQMAAADQRAARPGR